MWHLVWWKHDSKNDKKQKIIEENIDLFNIDGEKPTVVSQDGNRKDLDKRNSIEKK